MNTQANVRWTDGLKAFSRLDGTIVVAAGVLVLAGWVLEVEVLMRVLPGLVAMNPLTAISFVAAGLSLACFWTAKAQASAILPGRVGQLLAMSLVAVGFLKLADYAFHWNLGIDQVLFRARLETDAAGTPNRMAPNTALNFLLSGLALFLLNSSNQRRWRAAQNLSLIVGFHSLLAVLGYAYSAAFLYGVGSYIPMALHTASLFLLLAIGLLFAQTDHGAVALFVSNTPGGTVARRLLPVAFAVPAFLGAFRLWGERRGLYPAEFGDTVMVLACMMLFAGLVWVNAVMLNRADAKRRKAETALKEAHDRLENRVEERTAELRRANETLREEMAERRRAELQIREQADLLDKARDAIVVRDLSDRIVFWNKGAERLYGWEASDVVGRNGDGPAFMDGEKRNDAKRRTLAQGEWCGELRQTSRSGAELIVESRWTLVRDDQGNPKCFLTIETDVTTQRKLEGQFLRAQRMDSIGALAGGIAHDLNNALVPILVGSELMRESKSDTERAHLLGLIDTSAQRCSQMVKQILSFARGAKAGSGAIPLSRLIMEMKQMAADTFPKNIMVHCDVPKDIWDIQGDATELHQILMNLCVNARDAMPQGGELILRAENVATKSEGQKSSENEITGPHVAISVSDTGTGMSPEILARIFEPFFTTKAPDKGTGLGLSTVAAIVKRNGGQLEAKSQVGTGTEFRILLPAARSKVDDEQTVQPCALPTGRGELVLVMDDEKLVLELAKTTLENFGYRVLTASNGMEGVICFGAHRGEIRALITDTDMPFMDGMAAIRAIQEVEPEIPIIIASGGTRDAESLQRINTTRVTILNKPYGVEQLIRCVTQVLGAAPALPRAGAH